MVTLSNADEVGAISDDENPICAALDEALSKAHERFWLAVPWVYTRNNSAWLLSFIDRVAAAKRDRHLDVRVYLRPDPVNAYAAGKWQQAGVSVVQNTTRTLHLHSKVVTTENVALVLTANLTDTDLFRNTNHFAVERDPEQVKAYANSLLLLEKHDEATTLSGDFVDANNLLPSDLLRYFGVTRLNPMQAEAIPHVMHSDRNLVVAAPTGSGKTLVAEVALLRQARQRGGAGVYLAPMRAIATEKRADWQRLQDQGIRVYKTTGEDDAFDPAQAMQADIIVATPEKWDSVSRRRLSADLVARIGTIVIDEVHLVDDDSRGPGLEALLARIHLAFPAARLIAMSGTLANADAIAQWVNAELYESNWRPITLTTVVVPYPAAGNWQENERVRNTVAGQIAHDTYSDNGAVLVFCGSRKGVEGCAKHLAETLQLQPEHRNVRNTILRQTLAGGVGFHHAGLDRQDRNIVEGLFRSGAIKVLVATSTVAAGVNLPARVVVVRDLTLGITDIGPSELLQMAGRAGRPGLETEGWCYVLAPGDDVARVQELLKGRPITSHIGDELTTHINTEIALGIIRKREEAQRWYERTFHARVAQVPVDVASAVQWLVDNAFARERDGVLEPTELGRATAELMIRVPSAAALESWLAQRQQRTADPTALEIELLSAACQLPTEFEELRVNRDEEPAFQALMRNNAFLRDMSLGRVRHLAVATSLLSSIKPDQLAVPNGFSQAAAVQQDVPRFLRFLARRGDERRPGAPDIMVAASDLATTLEYGIGDRGAGSLIEVLKRAYQPDESRRSKVLADYNRLRNRRVDSLQSAVAHLAPASKMVADQRPDLDPEIAADGEMLVGHLGRSVAPARVHVRVASESREIVERIDEANLAAVPIAKLSDLGRAGQIKIALEVVASTELVGTTWTYRDSEAEVAIPSVPLDLKRVERALAQDSGTSYQSKPKKSVWRSFTDSWRGRQALLDDAREQIEQAPPNFKRAAVLLGSQLSEAYEKAEAVEKLLQRRRLVAQTGSPRYLAEVADAPALTRFEVALLGAALLRHMGVECQFLDANIDGTETAFCIWRHQGNWYGLPVWEPRRVQTHGGPSGVRSWSEHAEPDRPPKIGWEVIGAYQAIGKRALPILLAKTSSDQIPVAIHTNGSAIDDGNTDAPGEDVAADAATPEPRFPQPKLPQGYLVSDLGPQWMARCMYCRRSWRIPKDRPLDPRNVDYLWDHVRGHQPIVR